jgi:hypothetical protein
MRRDDHGVSFRKIVDHTALSQPNSLTMIEFRQSGARRAAGTHSHSGGYRGTTSVFGGIHMRGMLLWLIGIPIPIIILLYLFGAM